MYDDDSASDGSQIPPFAIRIHAYMTRQLTAVPHSCLDTAHTPQRASRRSLRQTGHAPTSLTARRLKRASDGVWVFFTEIPTDTRLQIHQQIGDTD